MNSNNSPYKFNAKEFDAETGNYYYGARYYDPKFSIWLSVDPLAEEYPSWTPYHYAHNNPLRYIDPTGMSADDVIIKGKLADKATEQLNASTSLEITRDKKTGKLSATGEAETKSDQLLLEAIKDEKRTVKIKATERNKEGGSFIFGDVFNGSRQKKNGDVIAKQTLNPNQAKIIEEFAEMPEGSIAKHSVLEAYLGAKNDPGAYPQQKDAYLRAHNETNVIYPAGDYRKIAEKKSIRREIIRLPFSGVRVLLVKPGGQRTLFD